MENKNTDVRVLGLERIKISVCTHRKPNGQFCSSGSFQAISKYTVDSWLNGTLLCLCVDELYNFYCRLSPQAQAFSLEQVAFS